MLYKLENWQPKVSETAFIAPGAIVVGRVEIGEYASIWYNTVVRGDVDEVKIGAYTNIQDGAVLHEDGGFPLYVGERVTVGHRAILHGCIVEEGCLIGMGAMVLNGAWIGAGSVIGAGSLVTRGQVIPPGVLALGSPAKVVRVLSDEEIKKYQEPARRYRHISVLHKEGILELGLI